MLYVFSYICVVTTSAFGEWKGIYPQHRCVPSNLDEFVESIEKVIEKNANGIFHTSGSTCVTRYDFAKIIARKFGFDESLIKSISIKESKVKAKRPVKPCLNNSKCSKILGYNFSNIELGVLKVLNEIKNVWLLFWELF